MDKKRLDRIVREEVTSLLEAWRSRTPGTTGYRPFAHGRSRDTIEDIDPTTGFSRPWSTRGDYPRGGEDEPDDRTPEERRQDRERMRSARDREAAERSAKVDALFARKTKNVYTRGEGPARTVIIGAGGSITLPPPERYDFLANPANSDNSALRDQIDVSGYFGGPRPGKLFGYAQVEMDGGMWKVTGESPELKDAFQRPLVGVGATVEDAYRDLLGKVKNPEVSAAFSSAGTALEPISESRWGQLAGLMTEGKKGGVSIYVDDEPGSRGRPKFYVKDSSGERKKISAKDALEMIKADPKAKVTSRSSGSHPRDEAIEMISDIASEEDEAMDEGEGKKETPKPSMINRGAAPGSYRPTEKPDTSKVGDKRRLDQIEELPPFEGRRRR